MRRSREEKLQQVSSLETELRPDPISSVNPQRPTRHREMVAEAKRTVAAARISNNQRMPGMSMHDSYISNACDYITRARSDLAEVSGSGNWFLKWRLGVASRLLS